MRPVGRGPLPAFPPFDAVALADWLGAPVAMLLVPPGRLHYAANQSHSIGHEPVIAVAVTIEHHYNTDDHLDLGPAVTANVRTRLRQARGEPAAATVEGNIAEALRDYLETAAGRAGVSLAPGRRPPALDAHLNVELGGWSWRDVAVDDGPVQWRYVMGTEYGTNAEVVAMGGNLGNTLIAVVGPAQLLDRVAVRLWAPSAPPAR